MDTTVPDSSVEATVATTLSAETAVQSEPVELETVDAAEETGAPETSASTEATESVTEPAQTQSAPPAMLSSINYGIDTAAETKGGSQSGNVNKPSTGTFKPSESTGGTGTKREVYYNTAGVTMQVVLFPYKDCYNRNNAYDRILETVKGYTYTDENGDKIPTVFDGVTITENTFIGDNYTGRVFQVENINFNLDEYGNNGISLYKTFPLKMAKDDINTIDVTLTSVTTKPLTVEQRQITYLQQYKSLERFRRFVFFACIFFVNMVIFA